MTRRIWWIVLIGTSCGCKGTHVPFDRSFVSAALRQQTHLETAQVIADGDTFVPDFVRIDDGVSEDEAVALALANNAAFQEVLAELGFTRAEIVQAGLLTNPLLSVLFPLGPKQLEFTATLPLEALWLRPRRVALATVDSQRVAERLVQNGLDLIRDVRVAFADVERAEARVRLAADAVDLIDAIAALADARLKAGESSALEVSTARIEAQRSREDFVRLQHEATLATERLRSLLGPAVADRSFVIDSPVQLLNRSTVQQYHSNVAVLAHDALAARPDLRAAELAVDAACERAGLANLEYLTVSGVVDANAGGEKGFEAGPGLQVTLPIFHQNQGAVARAEAEVERSVRNVATVHDRIVAEVRMAHARVVQACDQFDIWQTQILPPTQEAVEQARKAFEDGDGSLVLVLETTRQLIDARVRAVEADGALRRAWHELERSVGRRLGGAEKTDSESEVDAR